MIKNRCAVRLWMIFVLGFVPSWTFAAADRDFYQGKTIQVVVGFDAGGGYDAYARLIARHLSRHIPGNPTVIVQNMPGAGTRIAANYLYNVAPKDGTFIGSVVQSTPTDQVLGEPGVRFDAAKFSWIGNPIVDNLVTLSTTVSGLRDLEDVKKNGGLICGGSGAGPTLTFPNILNHLLPTDARVVSGYPGVAAVNLALERGEVNCIGGTAWSSMKATMSEMMHEKKLNVLVQWGTAKDPEISKFAGREVPLITDYARSDIDRAALRLMVSTTALSRPLLAPPDVPPDRIALLRDAFDSTMKDPDFLADAAKAGMDVKPISGVDIQALVVSIVETPPEGVKRAQELIQ